MKVASFFAAGRERFGVWTEAGLIDCSRAGATTATASSPEPTRPDSVLELIEAGEAGLAGVETLLLRARKSPHEVEVFAADAVLWRAPVLRPSKVCCVAFNNSANSGRILQRAGASCVVHQAGERPGRPPGGDRMPA